MDKLSAFAVYSSKIKKADNNSKVNLKKRKNKSKLTLKTIKNELKNGGMSAKITNKSIKKTVHENKQVRKEQDKKEKAKNINKIKTKSNKNKNNDLQKKINGSPLKEQSEYFNLSMEEIHDSEEKGKKLFEWLINPFSTEQFFVKSWEKCPFYVSRKSPRFYSSLLSLNGIDEILRNNCLHFTRNVDVTSYTNGVRETHNPVGRAHPSVVWDYFSNGCSIRLLNPQTYGRKLHAVSSWLQEFFGSFVGSNAYLTPAGSQGFAPHYDDIEAFVLQVEGKKRWKLYAPRNDSEILPRYSSGNFTDEDLGEPVLECTLNAGDLLYFPRGTIHQARTGPDTHSLHITLSVYQKTSWGDFFEKLLPATLKLAIEENPEFREGLPLHYLSHAGAVHSDSTSSLRSHFMGKLQQLFSKLVEHAPIDATVDQLGKQFVHDALPPVLTAAEKACSVFGDGERVTAKGDVINRVEFCPDTEVRLLRKHILRLVLEDNTVRIYYYIDNSKVYHEEELQYIEIDNSLAISVEALIYKYPEFVSINDLPSDDHADKIQLCSDLWERGLIVTNEPLQSDE